MAETETKKTATKATAKKGFYIVTLSAKERDRPNGVNMQKANGVTMPVSTCKSILPDLLRKRGLRPTDETMGQELDRG